MEMWYHLDFSSHFEHNNASSKFNVTPKYYLKNKNTLKSGPNWPTLMFRG